MPDRVTLEIKDERTLTVMLPCFDTDTEQVGKFLVNAGQDGYTLKTVTLIEKHLGTQRDPYTETEGFKIVVTK